MEVKTPAAEEDNGGVGNEEHVEINAQLEGESTVSDRGIQKLSSSSDQNINPNINKLEGQLESTKAEIGEVRQENERLKSTLTQIVKDYQSLQMHFFSIVHQEEPKRTVAADPILPASNQVEEAELVSLSLGTSSSNGQKIKEDKNSSSALSKGKDNEKYEECLTLRLDCKYYDGCSSSFNKPGSNNTSPENSFEGPKEEESWPQNKKLILKSLRDGDEEVSLQQQVKKARVRVRTRYDAPTMNDGCQWRKYGQKIAKGNPCPRAYYRCTVAPSCPVRKQVQRCAEDRSILITTYEGTHNHPLPVSATAMASTTSAAASLLLSGSSTSSSYTAAAANLTASCTANLHGLNFGFSADMARSQRLVYLPNPPVSSATSHPTVTLDLVAPPPPQSSNLQANQFNWFSSSFAAAPRCYSSTSFDFSESSTFPTSSAGTGCQNSSLSLSLGRQLQSQELGFHPTYLQKAPTNYLNASATANQRRLASDAVAKAITTDPSFQLALAAAVSSYIGGHGAQGGGGGHGHGMKWPGEQFNTGNGCASSYLNRSTNTSSETQERNLSFLQPSLALPGTKSASAASTVDHNAENIK